VNHLCGKKGDRFIFPKHHITVVHALDNMMRGARKDYSRHPLYIELFAELGYQWMLNRNVPRNDKSFAADQISSPDVHT